MAEPATQAEDRLVDGIHVLPIRVYYEDTDASGVVYHANYLKFIERGRTGLLRRLGLTHRALADSDGVYFTLSRCELDYLAPGRLDDRLEVHTSVLALGGGTIETRQVVRRDGIDLFRGQLRLACVDGEGRPRRLPAAVRSALADLPRQDIPAQQSSSTLAEASR